VENKYSHSYALVPQRGRTDDASIVLAAVILQQHQRLQHSRRKAVAAEGFDAGRERKHTLGLGTGRRARKNACLDG
jgi:hypothetical protein